MRNVLKILDLSKELDREVYETIAEELFRADRGKDIVLHAYMLEERGNVSKCINHAPDYSEYAVSYGNEEYEVYSEYEKSVVLDDYIASNLFAFRPGFLSEMTGLDIEVFEVLCGLCESANESIAAIIKGTCGFRKFMNCALELDSAGVFLARYDGEERTVRINGETFYLYRVD